MLAGLLFGKHDRDHIDGLQCAQDKMHGELIYNRSLLVVNDKSNARRDRLQKVLGDYLPSRLLKESTQGNLKDAVTLSAVDGDKWGSTATLGGWFGKFDRILVDAPCSSERHVMHGSGGWSRAGLKKAAKLQQMLLRAVVRVLNPRGGRLVYSTCSIAYEENDGVVQKLLSHKRYGVGLRVRDPLDGLDTMMPILKGVERTDFGAILLPDASGYGPIYWALLEKDVRETESSEKSEPTPDECDSENDELNNP